MKNFLPGKLSQPSLYGNSRLNPVSKLDCIFSFLEKNNHKYFLKTEFSNNAFKCLTII